MPLVQNPSLGPGAAAMLVAVTNLTSAQIVTLSSVPVNIVPAPGPGKIIALIGMALVYNFGTHAFANGASDLLEVQFAGANNDLMLSTGVGGLITGSASGFFYIEGRTDAIDDMAGDINQAAQLFAANDYTEGSVVTATLGAGGLGYAIGDTGSINGGGNDATYVITSIGAGGAVTGFDLTADGLGYTTGNGIGTATGGAQPGVGVGFTVNITAVQTGDGTLKVVTYYQIIPVP